MRGWFEKPTPSMIFNVWLYLVLLPPYPAQQLVLEDMVENMLEIIFFTKFHYFPYP